MKMKYDPEEVRQLTEEGRSLVEVAEALHIHVSTVSKARKRLGIKGTASNSRYKYDRGEIKRLIELRFPVRQIADRIGCSVDAVHRIRRELGYAPGNPEHPPMSERLEEARRLIDDGASFAEVTRTTHLHHETLLRYFPGKQWTQEQISQYALGIRHAEDQIRAAWPNIRA